ncbi:MAG: flagellar basal body-associated FliL family protein [Maritimibacter sp.]|nr:flagellar basal body-associated FliL family protein [Maritimibacter sp.]
MAEEELEEPGAESEAPKKKGKRGVLIGLVLAAALGGGGFFAVYSGLILGHSEGSGDAAHGGETVIDELQPVAFVPLDPLVISIGGGTTTRHLRFRAELEVAPGAEADVTQLTPRVMDVLNSYLRAVEVTDLEDPSALIGLRAQMLRRIQLVTGDGRVRDLLVMEFVLS